jgi:phospholipase/carboxylesterase
MAQMISGNDPVMKKLEQVFGKLTALTQSSVAKPTKALVLLHGVGSNERDLFEIAPLMSDDRLIVSFRAPIEMGPFAYGWFHVQFTSQGPVHDWAEAKSSLALIEDALCDLSEKTGIPTGSISVFGFSQGAIMTIGLALGSELQLECYAAASGRTLPEFAEIAEESQLSGHYANRKVFVSHGVNDAKLPVAFARTTEKLLRAAGLDVTYEEFQSSHEITREMVSEFRKWLGAT